MTLGSLEQDFIDLFTGRKKAHLSKYVHMHRPEIYDEMVNKSTYYPYRLESKIIKNHANDIARNLPRVSHVIEIGPGSVSPVMAKSVPMIAALENRFSVECYSAVDLNVGYASGACEIIKQSFGGMKTLAINLDFILDDLIKIKAIHSVKNSRLIMSFGCTIFSNNNDRDTDKTIKNISELLEIGEYFIVGADISDSEQALAVAYYNDLSYHLMLNAMFGMKYEVGDDNFDATAFKPVFEWDNRSTTVKLFLKATRSQKATINNQKFDINKNAKYNIINSRKTTINEVDSRLMRYGIIITDIFIDKDDVGNKFALLKTKKIR